MVIVEVAAAMVIEEAVADSVEEVAEAEGNAPSAPGYEHEPAGL